MEDLSLVQLMSNECWAGFLVFFFFRIFPCSSETVRTCVAALKKKKKVDLFFQEMNHSWVFVVYPEVISILQTAVVIGVSLCICMLLSHSVAMCCVDACIVIAPISMRDLFFFFPVTNTFKRTNDFVASKAPASDLNHKFRCTVVDCLKFFRKAKLLHYHMKYFHGIEKSPEPEENPGKRHVQTRGSSASDKASQESLTRKRVSASSPSKHFGFAMYLYHEGLTQKAGVRLVWSSWIPPRLKMTSFQELLHGNYSPPGRNRNIWLLFLPLSLAAWVTLRKSHLRKS